jgi:hypothetical protein
MVDAAGKSISGEKKVEGDVDLSRTLGIISQIRRREVVNG